MSKIKSIIGNKKTEQIAIWGLAVSMPSLIFSMLAFDPESPDQTGTENQTVINQAFNKTAKHLTELLPELKQGQNASTNISTMETLKKLNKLGTEIPETITNQADNSAQQAKLEKELTIFLDALALDTDLTEENKYDILNKLKTNKLIQETNPAFNAAAGYLDECRIEQTTANNIYKCSTEKNKEDTNVLITGVSTSITLTFLLIGLGFLSEKYRGYEKEKPKVKNKKLGHDH